MIRLTKVFFAVLFLVAVGAPGSQGATSTVYSATKAAVRSLARTFGAELVDKKIRVNALAPGSIDTPIFGKLGMPDGEADKVKAYFESIIPMKRLGLPEELAKAALSISHRMTRHS